MKRWATRFSIKRIWLLPLLLVGGAIVNVAVAWGAANTFGKRSRVHISFSDGTSRIEEILTPAEQGWPLDALTTAPPDSPDPSSVTIGRMQLARHPIWPGFAINTLFYGAILWLMFIAPFALRRRRRIKRGLCPACAYPVGESLVCTECGEAVRAIRVERVGG